MFRFSIRWDELSEEQLQRALFSERARVFVEIEGSDKIYEALVDTGAQESCISKRMADVESLPVSQSDAASGGFVMADRRAGNVPSLGRVQDLSLTFFFLHHDADPVSLKHSYEILDMGHEPHDVILGEDLIPSLFPDGIPLRFIRSAVAMEDDGVHASVAAAVRRADALRCARVTSSTTAPLPSDTVSVRDDPRLVQGLRDLQDQVHDEGAGPLPVDSDAPTRAVLDVAPELADDYAEKRARMMEELQPLLAQNALIRGFCRLPESVVELHVDPTKKDKLHRRQYPMAHTLIPLVREVIQRWFDEGRIVFAPPNCPYNSPLLVVAKKDDEGRLTGIRVCLDVRLLNAALLLTDSFPLPKIDESLQTYLGCVVFGEFDLREAYLQFTMHPDARPYTAFTFEGKQYMFVGCPFGIKSLPGIFQRVITAALRGLDFIRPYIDNLPFGSRNWAEHLMHAKAVLQRLNECNLRVKPNVKVGYSSLRILGHLVSSEGVGLDPEKLAVLRDWPPPRTGEEMERFLGFIVFLSGNVHHFAELTAPLQAVKHEKLIPYDANPLLMEHFLATKHALLHAPTLQYPDFSRPFHLACDASNTGVGGVLFQPAAERPDEYITPRNIVAIFSHKLTSTEQAYPAYRKELLAVKLGLLRFHTYLWGRVDTVVITDHKPLTYIKTSPHLSPALEQWFDVIANYTFEIVHRPGVLHVMPDQLSRMYASLYDRSPVWGVPSVDSSCVTNMPLKLLRNRLAAIESTDASEHDAVVLSTVKQAITDGIAKLVSKEREPRARRPRVKRLRSESRRASAPNMLSNNPSDNQDEGKRIVPSAHVRPTLLPTPLHSTLAAAAGAAAASSAGEGRAAIASSSSISSASSASSSSSSPPAARTSHAYAQQLAFTTLSSTASTQQSKDEPTERRSDEELQLMVELERRGKRAPPPSERQALVHAFHLQGHYGRDEVFNKLFLAGYWWPSMRQAIDEELRSCDACIHYVVTKAGFHPSSSIVALLPGDHWQMDCATHLPPSDQGHTALLVVVDVCTGLILLLKPMKSITAEAVARKLLKLIALVGPPKFLQSDNGPEFSNDTCRALVKLLNVQHRLIAPYNPRADGKVERTIGVVVLMIKKLLHGTTHHWPLFVVFAQIHFNDKISSLTGSTPFALFFGRAMNKIFVRAIDAGDAKDDEGSTGAGENEPNAASMQMIDLNDWRRHQEMLVSLVYPAISDRVRSLKDAMMKRLDKHRRLLTESIPTGAVVMVKDPNRGSKLDPVYMGPYTIVRRTQNGTYVLKDQLNDLFDRHVPADQLKLISKTPRPVDQSDAEKVYEVERVSDHRGKPGEMEFLTHWKGYSEPTWVRESDFIEHDCIKKYWKSIRPASAPRTRSKNKQNK